MIGAAVGGPVGAGIGAVAGAAIGGAAGAAVDDRDYSAVEPEFRHEWERGPYKASSSWDDASAGLPARLGEPRQARASRAGPGTRSGRTSRRAGRARAPSTTTSRWPAPPGRRRAACRVDSGGEAVVPIVEEQVNVGKREVSKGGVRVETTVTEKPVQAQVHLHEEHVNVQRRPVEPRRHRRRRRLPGGDHRGRRDRRGGRRQQDGQGRRGGRHQQDRPRPHRDRPRHRPQDRRRRQEGRHPDHRAGLRRRRHGHQGARQEGLTPRPVARRPFDRTTTAGDRAARSPAVSSASRRAGRAQAGLGSPASASTPTRSQKSPKVSPGRRSALNRAKTGTSSGTTRSNGT